MDTATGDRPMIAVLGTGMMAKSAAAERVVTLALLETVDERWDEAIAAVQGDEDVAMVVEMERGLEGNETARRSRRPRRRGHEPRLGALRQLLLI